MNWFKKLFDSKPHSPPTRPEDPTWFKEAWAERDNVLFDTFGKPMHGKIALPPYDLVARLCGSVDPQWLHQGVYVFEPTAERSTFAYCTAGLSTPWASDVVPEDPKEHESGLGCEVSMTLDRFDPWAIDCLMLLMFHEVAVAMKSPPGRPILPGEWIPYRPLLKVPDESRLRAFAVASHSKSPFTIRSGTVELLELIGMTANEVAWLRAEGASVSSFVERHEVRWKRTTVPDRDDLDVPRHPIPDDLAKYLD